MGIIAHEIMDIDPQVSSIFLGHKYDKQRVYRSHYARQYAKDMNSGNWNTNNPSPIVVAPVGKSSSENKEIAMSVRNSGNNLLKNLRELIAQGKLKTIDGQHRLHAIQMTGATIPFLVVVVEDAIGYKFMDIGHVRAAHDLVDIPNARAACAVSKRVVAMEQGASFRKAIGGNAGITTVETVQYVDNNLAYLMCIVRCGIRINKAVGCGAVSSYASVIHICENIYGEGTYEKLEEALHRHDESTILFVSHLNMLYGGRSSPRAEVTAFKFAEYCEAVMEGKKPSVNFSHGISVLKDWELRYEPEKKRSDFYDAMAKERKRKK